MPSWWFQPPILKNSRQNCGNLIQGSRWKYKIVETTTQKLTWRLPENRPCLVGDASSFMVVFHCHLSVLGCIPTPNSTQPFSGRWWRWKFTFKNHHRESSKPVGCNSIHQISFCLGGVEPNLFIQIPSIKTQPIAPLKPWMFGRLSFRLSPFGDFPSKFPGFNCQF